MEARPPALWAKNWLMLSDHCSESQPYLRSPKALHHATAPLPSSHPGCVPTIPRRLERCFVEQRHHVVDREGTRGDLSDAVYLPLDTRPALPSPSRERRSTSSILRTPFGWAYWRGPNMLVFSVFVLHLARGMP